MRFAWPEAHFASEEIARGAVSAFAIELGHDVTASCDEQAMQIVGTACNGLQELTQGIGIYARFGRADALPTITEPSRHKAGRGNGSSRAERSHRYRKAGEQ